MFAVVCRWQEMRRSSYGGDESEESDVDQSPTLPRRGRRQAIFDPKVCPLNTRRFLPGGGIWGGGAITPPPVRGIPLKHPWRQKTLSNSVRVVRLLCRIAISNVMGDILTL